MSVFDWFNTKEADLFARAVADDLAGRLPVSNGGGGKAPTPSRVHNTHEALVARARAFARSHRLNWYKKAHLGNTFRWVLLERGYDKAFVDTWTHNLMIAVTLKQGTGD